MLLTHRRRAAVLGIAAALAALAASGCGTRTEALESLSLSIQEEGEEPPRVIARLEGSGAVELRKRLDRAGPALSLDDVFYLSLKPTPGRGPVPILARIEWGRDRADLVPQASLTRGLTYLAVFEGGRLSPPMPRLTREYRLPADASASEARITAFHPSLPELPANLLKFYVHFSEPMGEGRVLEHARVLDSSGKPIDLAFRGVELWDREHRRLTLWIQPGRTKQALGLSEEMGPVLKPGLSYTFEVTPGMTDQRGRPLPDGVRHVFRTTEPDHSKPRMAGWRVEPPLAGSREPLRVTFGEPLDHALALSCLSVQGPEKRPVKGSVSLGEDGRAWSFVPTTTWSAGGHTLAASGELEDLAGNSLYRAFETGAAGERPRAEPPVFERRFMVGR
jgi:hypothetical protein